MIPLLPKSRLSQCCLLLLISLQLVGQNQSSPLFQLSTPLIESDRTFFESDLTVKVKLGLDHVQFYYTLDGTEPDSLALRYSDSIPLSESAQLKVKAIHQCCLASETAEQFFFKVPKIQKSESQSLVSPAHEKYPANGVASLNDLVKAKDSYSDPAWLGFAKADMEVLYTFKTPLEKTKLTISSLSDPNSWIFPPKGLELWTSKDGKTYTCVSKDSFPVLTEMESPQLRFYSLSIPPSTHRFYKVVVRNTQTLPDWHLRAGKGSWLFVDEIIWQ